MAGQFSAHIWTSITAGFILAFPYIIYEFWKFVSPGLRSNERKNARGFIIAASLLFFTGVLVFTFVEYAMHRWLYHPPEDASDKYQEFTYTIHGHHHAYPKDKQRLAMPPLLAIGIGTGLLLLFKLILDQYTFAFLAGFMVGYAMYLLVHYAVHMYKMPSNFLKALWINHSIHHYADDDEVLFGVSSPLWDYVFGTVPKKKSMKGVEVKKDAA